MTEVKVIDLVVDVLEECDTGEALKALCQHARKLEGENERYKAALEFYEEKENWYGDEENNINPPAIDEGERAREALE